MPSYVEMVIGSGSLNPIWEISAPQELELLAQFSVWSAHTLSADRVIGRIRRSEAGFAGFLVTPSAESAFLGPRAFVASGGIPGRSHNLERYLFSTAPADQRNYLGLSFDQLTTYATTPHAIGGLSGAGAAKIECESGTVYAPDSWLTCRLSNNCYNYALDIASGRYPPKIPQGTRVQNYSCSLLRDLVTRDGLTLIHETEEPTSCPPTGHIVAICLMTMGNLSFHCFRRDRVGYWSHKMNVSGCATDLDDNGARMPTLHGARFDYPLQICGFFKAPTPAGTPGCPPSP